MRKVDLFVPLLTGDPASKAADIVGGVFGGVSSQSMTSDQDLNHVIRKSCITLIILLRLLEQKLIALNPLDIAEFGKTNAQALLAATEARVQSQALQRAKDGR
jgi:hypothetical protein